MAETEQMLSAPAPKADPQREDGKASPGEQLVQSLFKLLKLAKIYSGNNRFLQKSIDDFRQAIASICAESESANLRIHRGRFYLNRERIASRAGMMGTFSRLIDFLQARDIQGIRFYEKDDISNEEIVGLVDLLNKAERQKDPISWLQVQFDTANYSWIEILIDQDFKMQGEGKGGARLSELSHSHAMISIARKTYSHALTSMLSLTGKLTSKKRVGIQRLKRVVQDMIDILIEDESVLLGMSTIRDYDDYTYTHSVNVSILSMCLGKRLGLSRAALEQLGLSALFHDLGKVDVPIEFINKKGRLTDDEYEEVKKHSLHSVRQIIRLNADHALKSKLLLPPFEHHLGVNLDGYPKTSRTAPLSLFGRILAVADHYDALTSARSYRPVAISPDRALKIMVDETGKALDPIVMKAFIDMIGVYPVGSLLVLDSGEVCLAIETPEGAQGRRPIACILNRNAEDKLEKGDLVDLSEQYPETGRFKRNIINCFHPSEYGIQPADFLF